MNIQSDIIELINEQLGDEDLADITIRYIGNIKDNMIPDKKAGETLMQDIERLTKRERN